MNRTLYGFALSARIEYHWFWIMRYRKRGNRMIESGTALLDPELLKLNKKLTTHGMRAMALEKTYEKEILS